MAEWNLAGRDARDSSRLTQPPLGVRGSSRELSGALSVAEKANPVGSAADSSSTRIWQVERRRDDQARST
eukprot:9471639-Alexandrium_andersonii.AAC.1